MTNGFFLATSGIYSEEYAAFQFMVRQVCCIEGFGDLIHRIIARYPQVILQIGYFQMALAQIRHVYAVHSTRGIPQRVTVQ
jgi:hypothetical protein